MVTQLAKLKEKHLQLAARIQRLEAAEKHAERKKDTRRKILIGAYYLDKARKENTETALAEVLSDYLKRDQDRALFGLSPLPDVKKEKLEKQKKIAEPASD